jgi:hypothetical protein
VAELLLSPVFFKEAFAVRKFVKFVGALAVLLALASCASAKKPGKPIADIDTKSVNKPEIIDYKGSEFQMKFPEWVQAYIEGDSSAVEALPKYAGKYCIIVDMDGQDKEGVILALSNLKAPVEIAGRVSTRVQQRFAGAQVGDQNKVETYMENVVKVAREASFSGFAKEGETWVYLQYFKPGKAKEPDKKIYRAYQLWTIDKAVLQQQIDKILNDEVEKAPSEEKVRAKDLVKDSKFFEGF